MSSDNIPELSYSTNINAGVTYYTDKVITGQYVSLNTTIKSDVTLQLVVQFSGDGSNWDYSISNSIDPNTNKNITVPVQAKWIRFCITNQDSSNSTYLRVYTYGTPTNSSILAQITKIGNMNPVVDLGNLPSNFATPTTLQLYKFPAGPTNPITSGFYSFYPTLVASGSATTIYSYTNNALNLSSENAANTSSTIQGTPINPPTSTSIVTFSAKFVSTSDSDLGGTAVVGFASNFSDIVCVGYNSTGPGLTYNDWGLYLYPAGAFRFVSHTSFNVDPCDGTVNLPPIDTTMFQTYQFVVTAFSLEFYIKYQGRFYLVHRVNYSSSTTPMFRDYSIGYFMRVLIPNLAVTTTGNISVSCSEWELQSVAKSTFTNTPLLRSLCYEATKSGITLEAPIFTLQNYTIYGAVSSFRTACISSINLARTSTGVGIPVTFRIYIDANIAGAAYSSLSSFSNLRVDTTGTLSAPGRLVYSYTLGVQESSVLLDRRIEFRRDALLTITATAASAVDVFISTNVY